MDGARDPRTLGWLSWTRAAPFGPGSEIHLEDCVYPCSRKDRNRRKGKDGPSVSFHGVPRMAIATCVPRKDSDFLESEGVGVGAERDLRAQPETWFGLAEGEGVIFLCF